MVGKQPKSEVIIKKHILVTNLRQVSAGWLSWRVYCRCPRTETLCLCRTSRSRNLCPSPGLPLRWSATIYHVTNALETAEIWRKT